MPRVRCVLLIVALLLVPATLFAQPNAGAASWQFPVDVRAEGMGRAYAVLDPGPFAARVNPGAMGLIRGFAAGAMQSRLLPELRPQVRFEYQAVAAAVPLPAPGAEVRLVLHLNRTWLDYGESIATESGRVIGTFDSWEETYGGGFAIGIGPWVGLGMTLKEIEVNLAPEEYGDGRDTETAWSYGALVRAPAIVLRGPARSGLRLTPSVGVGATNYGHLLTLTDEGQRDPLPQTFYLAGGAELALGSAADFVRTRGAVDRALRDVPLVALTVAAGLEDYPDADLPEDLPPDIVYAKRDDSVRYGGLELKLLGMFSGRWGYIHDKVRRIENPTWGIGMEVPGLFGLDFASVPQYFRLGPVHRTSVWARVPW